MDIKEKQAFENWWESFHNGRQISCDYVEEDNSYSVGYANAQWVAWQAKAQAVPEGFVLVPKFSANYLFNKVPELGFKHPDEKDTVLYHLNYMASEFKESARQFVESDHTKQKAFIKAQEQGQ